MSRALSQDVKTVVFKVTEYFRKRKLDKDSFEYKSETNITKIVAEATGYCRITVRNVITAGN